MKKILFAILLCLPMMQAEAQGQRAAERKAGARISQIFNNVSLSEALRTIDEATDRYKIHFIYNDLEDFRVTTTVERRSVPDAVRQVVGFYPMHVTVGDSLITVECTHKTDRHLSGTIVDEQGRPLAYANIALLNPADSTLLSGGVSNEAGQFVIPYEQPQVLARISFVGYKTHYRLCSSEHAGTIRLERDALLLKNVTVTSELPKYRMTKGGMLANVEGTILAELGNALDVLGQLPRVSVNDDKVSIAGKTASPLIYINGRLMRDREELRQLKSRDIRNIEVITTPGPQYAASVSSVIRIKTRRQQGEGWSGNLSHYSRWATKHTQFDYLNLNYRKNNFDIFTNLTYMNYYWQVDDDAVTDYQGNQHHITEHNVWTMRDRFQQYRGTVGFNWQLADNHSLGMRLSVQHSPYEQDHHATSDTRFLTDGEPSGTIVTTQRERYKNLRPTLDAYYQGKVGKMDIDLNATWLETRSDGTTWVEEQSQEYGDQPVTTSSESRGRMWAGKLVLTYPLSDRLKLEFGSEYTNSRFTQQHENLEGIVRSSDNRIDEQMAAGFAELELNYRQWVFSLGARFEHNNNDYYEAGLRSDEQSRSESHLLPTFTIGWNRGKWQQRLGMKTLAHRPSYSNLSSSVNYVSHYHYQGGNPHLKTQYNYAFEYSLAWQWMNLSVEYDYIRDSHTNYTMAYDDVSDIVFSSYLNVPHRGYASVTLSAKPSFGIWYPSAEISFDRQFFNYRQYGITENLERPYVVLKAGSLLKLSGDWYIRLDYSYRSRSGFQFVIGDESQHLNFSLDKYFLKKQLLARLYVSDLFRTSNMNVAIYNGHYTHRLKEDQHARYLQLGLTYYFNTTRSKYKGTGAGNAEQNRL